MANMPRTESVVISLSDLTAQTESTCSIRKRVRRTERLVLRHDRTGIEAAALNILAVYQPEPLQLKKHGLATELSGILLNLGPSALSLHSGGKPLLNLPDFTSTLLLRVKRCVCISTTSETDETTRRESTRLVNPVCALRIHFPDLQCDLMKTTTETKNQMSVAARIAGEDIVAGDYVTILSEVIEFPSFLWNCSNVSLPPDEPVRIRYLPQMAGVPHEVVTVCLPFVYAKFPSGHLLAFDVRQHDLVRLNHSNAQLIWREMRKPFQNRGKSKNRKKKKSKE